ncbi:MAG: response regulator [Desulfotignum sp.]|jgi:PAS domain S-box-containing protein|nr:response regulator [Desulfotignum sp.]
MGLEQILVVDDERRIVENISRCLNREGLEVAGAYNGAEAVAMCNRQRFDLVLLDISMPDMDGYQVMEQILGLDDEVLIVMMTGFATVESAVKALKKGAWDYLKKPFEFTDLVKTVKNGLIQKRLLADKKAVSARLDASEKQYENMVNNSPDLIFTLDEAGCFTFINDQCEKLLGISRNDILGNRFENFVHKQDQLKARQLTWPGQERFGTSGDLQMNFRFKKSGCSDTCQDIFMAYAFMELKASPMHLPAGGDRKEIKGLYCVARDVSERINLEAQLRQAQKMEAIGTLAGGIAHDFNNILMGIQGYASLVKTGFDRQSIEFKRLANIDEYVSSGAEMSRQLLGFAQKNGHETCLINLNFLLKMSAKMFGRTKKDIIIEPVLEKKLWGTLVDEGQIKQVLMNLFVNAWQAMPQGGRITIISENVWIDQEQKDTCGFEHAGAFVKITVKDTGIGMDKETMTRIFDPFFTTKERGQGTGLGLAMAYGIIKRHKGMFRVESTPGEGSAFMFFLPAKKASVAVRKNHNNLDKIINGKGTVLLVDDEKGVIEVCSEMLESLGYDVKTAFSGNEALKIMHTAGKKIDLVILDMVMPEMSGKEAFENIRRIQPDVRVLVSSGHNKEKELKQMMKDGCRDFIFKPFDVAMLSEKLNTIFNKCSETV